MNCIARIALCCVVLHLLASGSTNAEDADVQPGPSVVEAADVPIVVDESVPDTSASETGNGVAPPAGEPESANPDGPGLVGGNPAATDIIVGTGLLGRLIGFRRDSGVHVGGVWLGDADCLLTGGLEPGDWGYSSLTLVHANLDFEKLADMKGSMVGIEFLQLSASPLNAWAGVVQGYNSLPGPPPLVRQELYELWWRQRLLDDKLTVRIGKTVPTYDFNNVSRPRPVGDATRDIPAVTGLLYTPIFINPTLLGRSPGYYNSACGITATYTPSKAFYFSYGCYDGNIANGEQTGLQGPQFNGYYFHIGEAGAAWSIGSQGKPGHFAVGGWSQTGKLTAIDGNLVNGSNGVYLFGSQRLWFRNPGEDNSGVSGFVQFGANNSVTMLVRQYVGAGLTAFGLVPRRPDDSFGCGVASSFMNSNPNAGAFFFPGVTSNSTSLRNNETMMQVYYQAKLPGAAYFTPALSYIPNPGERPDIPAAVAATFRFMLFF